MSVIKQISIFNGVNSSWGEPYDIGANAGNIDLTNSTGTATRTIADSNNLYTGLINILPAQRLSANKILISDSNRLIGTVNNPTLQQLGFLSGTTANIQNQINTINTLIGDTNISGIGGGTVTGAISALNGKSLKYRNVTYEDVAITTAWSGLYYVDLEIPSDIRASNTIIPVIRRFTGGVVEQVYINIVEGTAGIPIPNLRLLSTISRTSLDCVVRFYYI